MKIAKCAFATFTFLSVVNFLRLPLWLFSGEHPEGMPPSLYIPLGINLIAVAVMCIYEKKILRYFSRPK